MHYKFSALLASVITLTLLHPMQSIPVQSWNFEHESVVRIGRSTDNHVILYSAVVSRHHVEIRQAETGWEIVNLGANGTYLEGRRITKVPVEDGVIIRLARSGPNVQVHLGVKGGDPAIAPLGEKTVGQRTRQTTTSAANVEASVPSPKLTSNTSQPKTDIGNSTAQIAKQHSEHVKTLVDIDEESHAIPNAGDKLLSDCCQRYVGTERLFCLDCGKPLKTLGTVGAYHIVKVLERDRLGVTQLVWQDGQTLILRTLNPEWASHTEALEMFEQEAEQLLKVNHPMLPRFIDVFIAGGQPYLVMQPLYGKSLQQVIATTGTVSLQQAIAWVLQACHALEYLHQQTPPLIHQDIRPENFLRRASANSEIALVGLYPCRSLKMAIQPDFAGYSAPEQQQGQAFTTSDLYALAPTLVYLLTGKPPTTFYTQREQGYRFYPEYVPGIDTELIPILRKLTNSAPDERYTSAQELVEALQELVPIGV